MQIPEISIVIPLYNEEAVFKQLITRLNSLMEQQTINIEIVLIDDGSKDRTVTLIHELCLQDTRYQGVILSRNHGHQLALSAGLSYARGTKAIMVMDGDLQDPPELLPDLYSKIKEGYEVVYAVRKKRKESLFKRMLYWTYYRIQQSVSSFHIPLDSGDFGMMSRKAVDHLVKMPEQSRYLRGMRSWIGFKQIGLSYERDARAAGNSSYGFRQLFALAYNGIFNFSEFPVKFITRMGMYSIVLSMVYLAYVIFRRIIYHDVPAGFTALIVAIVLFSGVQLISIGLLGEYVLRIYNQVRNRPLFVVDKVITDREERNG
ncbi:glycosyltransferase family 2 protein [soil metagenome]